MFAKSLLRPSFYASTSGVTLLQISRIRGALDGHRVSTRDLPSSAPLPGSLASDWRAPALGGFLLSADDLSAPAGPTSRSMLSTTGSQTRKHERVAADV